jgi:prophage regulatory protein
MNDRRAARRTTVKPATPEGDDGASGRTLNQEESVMSNTELITCQEVLRLTGIRSRSTIWRKMRKGGFPHPVDIGGGRIRWRAADISEWINALPLRRY